MANQGLFTSGPSVNDLLQQRNKRSSDLQQQLMNQAAQGARDPAKARAVSFLGSSLGRALGGSMGGDTKTAEIEAKNAAQKELQNAALKISSTGTSAEQQEFALLLNNQGFSEDALKMSDTAKATKKAEQITLEAKDEATAALASKAQVQTEAQGVADSLKLLDAKGNAGLITSLTSGTATCQQKII